MIVDLELVREMFGVVASAVACVSTFWFWLLRTRSERPQLDALPIGPLSGCVLTAHNDLDLYQRLQPSEGQIVLRYWMDIAVINASRRPNAILSLKVLLESAEGSMQAATILADPGDKTPPFPINLAPETTSTVRLAVAITVPGTISSGHRNHILQAGDQLAVQPRVSVYLTGLGNQIFANHWQDSGTGLWRTESMPSKAA